MGSALALLACALSLTPVLLAGRGGALEGASAALGGAGLLPLALLPWVALAGLPLPRPSLEGSCGENAERRSESGAGAIRPRGPAPHSVWLALALPGLALAARLDRLEGRPLHELAWTAGGGLLFALLLAEAARRAARPPREGCAPFAGSLHAVLWALLLPVPAALWLALAEVARGRGPAPAWPGELLAASPLGWLAPRAADASAGGPPWAPAALCLALLLASHLAAGRRRPEGAH